jgi:hypothetical protein
MGCRAVWDGSGWRDAAGTVLTELDTKVLGWVRRVRSS